MICLLALGLVACQSASEELSEEKIIAIAKEHGVEAWFEASDPASQTKKLNFTTEEEYHEYFSSIGALNRDISESNERNRQRNVELEKRWHFVKPIKTPCVLTWNFPIS